MAGNSQRTYSAMDIANYMLFLMSDSFKDVTNMKLNKILYYAQGHCLKEHGTPLFSDEIMAWQHGPVVPSVYQHYKSRGSKPINTYNSTGLSAIDEKTQAFLMEVARRYGRYTAATLRNMTHKPKTPWAETEPNSIISNEAIKDYFVHNMKALEPLEIEYTDEDFVGHRDSNGTLVLPEEWRDEEV